MDDSIGLLLLFQLVLIILNAIFASAEIAVLSISETKLEHMADDGNGRAKKLYKLAKACALSRHHSGSHNPVRLFRQRICGR